LKQFSDFGSDLQIQVKSRTGDVMNTLTFAAMSHGENMGQVRFNSAICGPRKLTRLIGCVVAGAFIDRLIVLSSGSRRHMI